MGHFHGIPDEADLMCSARKRLYLQQIDVVAETLVSRGTRRDSESWKDSEAMVNGAFRAQLTTYVMGLADHVEVVRFTCPKNWWEMLKEDHAPQWFLDRWPVRYVEIRREVQIYRAVCPHIESNGNGEYEVPGAGCLQWMAGVNESG